MEPSSKRGRDKINRLRPGRKNTQNTSRIIQPRDKNKNPALREVDMEPSFKKWTSTTKGLASLYELSHCLPLKLLFIILDFLSNLYDHGLSQNVKNSTITALSHIILIPLYAKPFHHAYWLSQKPYILLLSLGGQRMNTVFNFEVDNIFINAEWTIFSPNKIFQQSKPGSKLDQFTYRSLITATLCSRHSTRLSKPQEYKGAL